MKNGIAIFVITGLLSLLACKSDTENKSNTGSNPTVSSVPINEGSGAGNGGGIIRRNGQTLTLVQAGISFQLDEVEDPAVRLPSILLLQDLVDHLALTDYYKTLFLRAIRPTDQRKYFIIPASEMNPTKRRLLIAQYKALLGQDLSSGDELSLAAITIGAETYLLPEFSELTDDKARAAILIHEALWVVNSKLKLSDVIRVEMSTEKLLRTLGDNVESWGTLYEKTLFKNIGYAFKNPNIDIVGVVLKEFSNGLVTIRFSNDMVKTFTKPEFSYAEILGEESLRAATIHGDLLVSNLKDYWKEMIRLNPNSKIFPKLMEYVDYVQIFTVETTYWNRYPLKLNQSNKPKEGFMSLFQKKFLFSDLLPGDFYRKDSFLEKSDSWTRYCQVPGFLNNVYTGPIIGADGGDYSINYSFLLFFHSFVCFNERDGY